MRADTRDLACVRAQKMESRPPRRARGPPTLQANGSAAAARWLEASAGKRPAPFEGIAGRRPAPRRALVTQIAPCDEARCLFVGPALVEGGTAGERPRSICIADGWVLEEEAARFLVERLELCFEPDETVGSHGASSPAAASRASAALRANATSAFLFEVGVK